VRSTTLSHPHYYNRPSPDAEKAFLLVKIRCFFVADASGTALVPSYLQARMAQGRSLPHVVLRRAAPSRTVNGGQGEERRKLRTMLAFLVGIEGSGLPRDVFRLVMDLLMPSWDPLRRGVAGMGPQAQG